MLSGLALLTQRRANTRQQLLDAKRLAHIIHCPQIKGAHALFLGAPRAQDHNWRRCKLTNALQQLQATHARNLNIQQRQIGLLALQVLERLEPISHREHTILLRLQIGAQVAHNARIAITNQDTLPVASPTGAWMVSRQGHQPTRRTLRRRNCCRVLSSERQTYVESRAQARASRLCPDATSMRLDNRPGNSQTHSAAGEMPAFSADTIETLKNALKVVLRKTAPLILNADLKPSIPSYRPDENLATSSIFQRVVQEMVHHLLQSPAISHQRGKISRQFKDQMMTGSARLPLAYQRLKELSQANQCRAYRQHARVKTPDIEQPINQFMQMIALLID